MEDRLPEVMCFAGPNGSGKSTITKVILPYIKGDYINADDIKKATFCDDLESAEIAEKLREGALKEGNDFAFETVLSTKRNVELLQRAKEAGYFIRCIFVLTNDHQINVDRVRCRVAEGGHDVPEEKIITRYYKSLQMISVIAPICDRLNIYDNSGSEISRIYKKRDDEEFLYPNKYWSAPKIRGLICGNTTIPPHVLNTNTELIKQLIAIAVPKSRKS